MNIECVEEGQGSIAASTTRDTSRATRTVGEARSGRRCKAVLEPLKT